MLHRPLLEIYDLRRVQVVIKLSFQSVTVDAKRLTYNFSVGRLPLHASHEGLDPHQVEDEMHHQRHHEVLVYRQPAALD